MFLQTDVSLVSLGWQLVTCSREAVWWEGWEKRPPSLPLSGKGAAPHLWSRGGTGCCRVVLVGSGVPLPKPEEELEDPGCPPSPNLTISLTDLHGTSRRLTFECLHSLLSDFRGLMLSTLQSQSIEMRKNACNFSGYTQFTSIVAIICSLNFYLFPLKRAVVSENLKYTFCFLNLLKFIWKHRSCVI